MKSKTTSENELSAIKDYYLKKRYLLRIRENLSKFAPLKTTPTLNPKVINFWSHPHPNTRRRRGGIGRRAGFKIQFTQVSGGSIPPVGTN